MPQTTQEIILQRFESGGHAIEVRLCAEDPAHDFLPQSGRLLRWQPGTALRVDHALQSGQVIPPYYDSMVAKFIAHADNRDAARQALQSALTEAVVLGVQTNQAYLAACLHHPAFAAGQASTGFIAAHGQALLDATPALPPALAALALYAARALCDGHDPTRVDLPLAWPVPMRLQVDGHTYRAAVHACGGNRYAIQNDDLTTTLELVACDAHGATFAMNDAFMPIAWAWDNNALVISLRGRQSRLVDHSLSGAARADAAHGGAMRAPMAGRIVALPIAVGQRVRKGELLLVLEAMKMEHPSVAPMDAVVATVRVAQGAQVLAGALLVELLPDKAAKDQR